MSTESFSRFFATLALATFAATAVVVIVWVVARLSPQSGAAQLFGELQPYAMALAWVVAAVTTLGSLYYSLVAHFEPCELCWYQRICVYPLSVVLLIAAWRRDVGIWRYALPPAIVGIVIAAYHAQLQAFPSQETFCSQTNPCTIRYVWEFGFVSLPLIDLAALLFITTMLFVVRAADRSEQVIA